MCDVVPSEAKRARGTKAPGAITKRPQWVPTSKSGARLRSPIAELNCGAQLRRAQHRSAAAERNKVSQWRRPLAVPNSGAQQATQGPIVGPNSG